MDITAVKTDLCWVKCSGTRLDGWCRWRLFALWRPEMWTGTCTSCRLVPVRLVKTMKLFLLSFLPGCYKCWTHFRKKKKGNSWIWWSLSRVWSPWRCFCVRILRDAVEHMVTHILSPHFEHLGGGWLLWAPRLGVSQEGADLEDCPSPGLR